MRNRCMRGRSREFEVHHSRERGNLETCESAGIIVLEQILSSLRGIARPWAIRGEAGRGGSSLAIGESSVSFVSKCFSTRSMIYRNGHGSCPLTLTLSPNTKNVLGEREQIVETLSQGCASGSCRSLALGYFLTPRWGSIRKKRPPCRFTKIQSPGSRESWSGLVQGGS
jgi:hypothetical protein